MYSRAHGRFTAIQWIDTESTQIALDIRLYTQLTDFHRSTLQPLNRITENPFNTN